VFAPYGSPNHKEWMLSTPIGPTVMSTFSSSLPSQDSIRLSVFFRKVTGSQARRDHFIKWTIFFAPPLSIFLVQGMRHQPPKVPSWSILFFWDPCPYRFQTSLTTRCHSPSFLLARLLHFPFPSQVLTAALKSSAPLPRFQNIWR